MMQPGFNEAPINRPGKFGVRAIGGPVLDGFNEAPINRPGKSRRQPDP